MLWELLRTSADRTGRLMTIAIALVGFITGALVSNSVHITDQYWTNAGILTVAGTVGALLLDFFFVSPIRLWQRSKKELEACQQQEKAAPLAVHHGSGNLYVFNNPPRALMESVLADTYILSGKSHRITRSPAVVPAQQSLELLLPRSELPRPPEPEASEEH